MSAKEIKGHLKAAKQAIDKQDFQSAITHCQAIFRADERHYTGLVFAGLASLKLGEYEQSRSYYRTAVALQPDGHLAWKGFADYYDKRRAVVKDEQLEAIEAYTKLLTFIESDVEKVRSTYLKLIKLHKEFNDQDRVIECYSAVGATYSDAAVSDDSTSCSQVWTDFTAYLLGREQVPEGCWAMVQQVFPKVLESEEKQVLRAKLVKKLHRRFMTCSEYDAMSREFLMEECTSLVAANPLASLPILLHLLLMKLLPLSHEDLIDKPVKVTEQQRDWIKLLGTHTRGQGSTGAEGGIASGSGTAAASAHDSSLEWAGQALVGVADGKWSEAKDAIDKSVNYSRVPCECWLLCALLHLRLHDYKMAEKATESGLSALSSTAKFNVSNLERGLKLCQCQAYVGRGSTKQLSQALPFLKKAHEARDSHVTAILVKAHLLLGDIQSAQSVLGSVSEDDGRLVALQGEVYLAERDYEKALTLVSAGLKVSPTHPSLLFVRARALWEQPQEDKSDAYSALLQAAKADPTNPNVFLYLGHYQKLVTGDLKRAEKCYHKAFSLQPSHPEAALCLGDMLWTNGEEEKAYEIYRAVTSDALPSRTKVAWIRMGLYQKTLNQYTEAIQSFQIILSFFPDDKHCWECLGEAYLARGSHSSALKTFNKCIQLDPDSVQCHYQIAYIKQLLGFLRESLLDYSSVLEREAEFVPALKGAGEAHLKLARLALQQNFDGTAVDHVSLAIQNLTRAARLRPNFTCVWKLLGDSCLCLNQLPLSVVKLTVPSILRSGKAEGALERIEKRELLEIGCRCYGKGLKIQPEAAHLWHDLSLGYFHLARSISSDCAEKQQTLEAAVNASKKAVSLKPSCHNYWNTLGVITASTEINNPALAQHSFIRSIQEENNNALAWSNLGALYWKHDNTELAYEAFKKAQSLSPDCVQAWIGHALIAERIGSEEAMDLFRHCTELEYHPEASAGYGYWVCQTLSSISPRHILRPGGVALNEVALRGVLQARDNLQKSASRDMVDTCTLNLLGLLYEHEGILTEARRIFERALECSTNETDSNVLAVKYNLARVQSALGQAPEAVGSLMGMCKQENSSDIWLELALALYRHNNLADSHEAYEQSALLSKRSNPEASTSAILTAQVMVAFSNGDSNTCKKLLFQGFQSTPVSLHCLVSLCALAYLTSDSTLLLATLQELEKVAEWQTEECYLLHPSCSEVLRALKLLLGSDLQDCVSCLDKILQSLPHQTEDSTPPPSPTVLHVLLAGASPEAIQTRAQKLLHAHPTSVWALALMTSQVGEEQRLKDGYKSATQHYVESEIAALSLSGGCSPWHKGQERSMTALRIWLDSI